MRTLRKRKTPNLLSTFQSSIWTDITEDELDLRRCRRRSPRLVHTASTHVGRDIRVVYSDGTWLQHMKYTFIIISNCGGLLTYCFLKCTRFFFLNSIQLNSIQFNSIQFNSIQFNSIQFNSIQLNSTQLNSTQLNSTQLNSTQLNSTQLNSTQLN